jgi:alkanesulfonate monooxygenase SsuD/methylene tetrahydromethanopterin reductase-like flavin-dependent oxidoreductase (luciferase family)
MAERATRQLHLNLFIHGRGHHEAAWRHPTSSTLPLTDIRYYTDLARKAEAGLFDSVFLADTLAVGDDVARAPRTWLEPITALAALAGATSRIGLIATCSTTYTEPFNLARQFASLDHITGGRVGWNIVTTWLATASGNFGGQGPLSHADRYDRAEEYLRVVTGLWDSWSDDAVLDDRTGGQYARDGSIRAVRHTGAHYQVAGPLNMPRGPQGRPVFVQAADGQEREDVVPRVVGHPVPRLGPTTEVTPRREDVARAGDDQRGEVDVRVHQRHGALDAEVHGRGQGVPSSRPVDHAPGDRALPLESEARGTEVVIHCLHPSQVVMPRRARAPSGRSAPRPGPQPGSRS